MVVNDQALNFTIPFQSLAQSQSQQLRFGKSRVTFDESFSPQGPSWSARAMWNKRVWLLWGSGKAPLVFDTQGAWPYRLIRIANPHHSTSQLVWVNVTATQKVVAQPDQIQTIKVGLATWCTWVAMSGSYEEAREGLADGEVPTISWMLWRRPNQAACA
jgi:hypothetical protein